LAIVGAGQAAFRFQLVGPLAVIRDHVTLPPRDIGSRKERTLLKLLLVERGHVVPSDRIAEVLWDGAPPARWDRHLATLVSRLRAVFGPQAIAGDRAGYRFVPGPGLEVDIDEAERLAAEAEARLAAGEPALARVAAERALDVLGSGNVLEDEPYGEWAEEAGAAASRLLRRTRRMAWRAALDLSDHEAAARDAEAAVAADPLDEEAHRTLMLARYRAGRPADALAAYERLRTILAEELGADPGPETRALHVAILREETAPPAGEAASRTPPPEPTDPGFVGRDDELARLAGRWSDAVAGHPRLVLLAGEAGIGKTRLATEVLRLARSSGGTVAQTRCYQAERSMFLEPIVDAVRSVVVSTRPDVVRETVGEWAGPLSDLVPEVGRVLRPLAYERATAEIERRRAFEAVTAFFRETAARGPVLLFLDDLHHAGSSTLELLHFLARRTTGARLLVLATLRTEEGAEALTHLADVAVRMDLGPLPEAAVSELARRAGAGDMAERIQAMTRGHPLFVVEILRTLAERPETPDAGVPETLLTAVLDRVGRTGPGVEEFLRVAATLGVAFDLEVAAGLLEVGFEEAARRADAACRARLLVEAGATFEFANELIRDILYRTTPVPALTARHRRAAALLRGNPEAVATHATAAGDWGLALEAWRQAADRAAARFANRDAEWMLDRALEAAANVEDPAGQADALLARGRAREALADFRNAHQDNLAALELARRAGDPGLEMRSLRALGGDPPIGLGRPAAECLPYLEEALGLAAELSDREAEVDMLSRMAVIQSNRLRFDLAYRHAGRAVELARELGDPRAVATALDGLKTAAAYSGDLGTLESILPELERILRQHGEFWLLQWAVFESSFAPMARADWDRAVKRIDEALVANRRIGSRAFEPMFVAHQAWINRSRGQYGRALELGRQAVEMAHEVGHPWWRAFAEAFLGGLLIELHTLDQAAPHVERGLQAAELAGAESYLVRCLGLAALAAWLRSDRPRSLAFLERAEAMLEEVATPTGHVFLHGFDAYLSVARARLEMGDVDRARDLVEGLRTEAEAAGWREAAARASTLVGRCHAALGDVAGAEPLLLRALQIAEESALPGAAWEAHAAMAAARLAQGSGDQAAEHLAEAERIVDSLARSLPQGELRRRYRREARASLGS
jgi:DNA-binding SARP family transcriptional activator